MAVKYFISYTVYYDCPTCDGNGAGDIEHIHLSNTFDNIKQIADYIQTDFGTYFLVLYQLEEFGEITKVCDFTMHNSGHRTYGTSFTIKGETYKVTKDDITSTDETFNLLYAKR